MFFLFWIMSIDAFANAPVFKDYCLIQLWYLKLFVLHHKIALIIFVLVLNWILNEKIHAFFMIFFMWILPSLHCNLGKKQYLCTKFMIDRFFLVHRYSKHYYITANELIGSNYGACQGKLTAYCIARRYWNPDTESGRHHSQGKSC